MAKKMKNKGKMWRRLANKLKMTVPIKVPVVDENGNESERVELVKTYISGQQLRHANKMKPTINVGGSVLLMTLMEKGGYLIKNTESNTINNDSDNESWDNAKYEETQVEAI